MERKKADRSKNASTPSKVNQDKKDAPSSIKSDRRSNSAHGTPSPANSRKEKVQTKDLLKVDNDAEMLAKNLGFLSLGGVIRTPRLRSVDFDGVVEYMNSPICKNIIVMAGAGISVAANIPDFRSPGTGIYSKLDKYDLPFPEAIFSIEYFKADCKPFFSFIKEFFSENYKPTDVHYFIRLLDDKKLLLRLCTQNIDALELKTGLPEEKIVFSHGSFSTSTCLECGAKYDLNWFKSRILDHDILKCEKSNCNGIVKPDITFFGEELPERFNLFKVDFPKADLLFVIGTSLEVYPFAGLVCEVSPDCPRVLINNKIVGKKKSVLTGRVTGFDWSRPNHRDVKLIGDCQEITLKLAGALGWAEELQKLKSKSIEDIP